MTSAHESTEAFVSPSGSSPKKRVHVHIPSSDEHGNTYALKLKAALEELGSFAQWNWANVLIFYRVCIYLTVSKFICQFLSS